MRKEIALFLSMALTVGMMGGCAGNGNAGTSGGSTVAQQMEEETVQSSSNTSFDGTVVLGATAPLTGPNQLTGGYYVNGMNQAVNEINAAGGILGKELVLDVQDEGADQSIAINATIKLIESGVPAIIGSYFSTNCMAVLPEIEKNRNR